MVKEGEEISITDLESNTTSYVVLNSITYDNETILSLKRSELDEDR
jgi:hypothetical protein